MASREISQLEEQGTCCPPPPDAPPILCVNNCGFFGTRENNNLCSCCFKKALMASIKPSPSSSSLQQGSSTLCLVKEGSAALSSVTDPSPFSTYAEPDPTLLKEGPPVKEPSPSSQSSASCAEPSLKEGSPVPCSVKEPSPSSPSLTSCAEPDPTLSTSSTCAPPPPQKPNRCFSCRKRVGLTGFKCRCGDVFCSLHRYSDKHDCSFDYKAAARGTIAKQNPVVKADKVTKI